MFGNQTIIIICMPQLENNNAMLGEVLISDRRSDKSSSTQSSQAEQSSVQCLRFMACCPYQFRLELFPLPLALGAIQISQKMNQRAVSWLVTLCWSKSISQECLWSALLLYYVCRSKGTIRKQRLELTMLGCLSLALKMTDRTHTPRQLASLSQASAAQIIATQADILELVDYNLIIPHQLCQLMHSPEIPPQRREEAIMVCELLMLQGYDIFVDAAKLESILRMLGGEEMEALASELRELLRLKEATAILRKYSSSFDTEAFKARFL